MNKVDILPRDSLAPRGQTNTVRRGAPRAVKLLLPVWGYTYVRQFLEFSLPTLLAPGNVPAVAAALPTEFVLLTSVDDEPFIREHPAFRRLTAVCSCKIHPIDHLITEGNYSTTITLAYTEAVREVGDAMADTCFFFLVSDYIVADGSLASVLKRMQRGTSAVVTGNFQVTREDALWWLQEKLAFSTQKLVLPPRDLMDWALNYLHPATLANTVNIPLSHNSHTNRLFWRVDATTILGRFYLMHMLCVRPENTDFVIGASCDYSFIPEMCPSGNFEIMDDSDEYLVIEMQPRNHEAAFLRPGPLNPRKLARSLNQWTTQTHRDNAHRSVIFHAGELPRQLKQRINDADTFVASVAHHMRPRPLPHRGHPYWHGAMAAFSDATGRKIAADEWRYVLGAPPDSDWRSQWLWRARHAIMGRPPFVKPWDPSWPDYRTVLRELQAYLADPNQRMLILSNEPTALSVALADSGERAHRIRCVPFMQTPPERYEPLRGKFDLCLIELTEGDMNDGDVLTDRIVPLMKNGGNIIVFVRNRRGLSTAHEFGMAATHHSSRFIRSGALPIATHFVPANNFRWLVLRGMSRLRALGAWAVILGTGPLLFLSLVGSLDALRRARPMASRGIVSSLVMRLSVDAPKIDKTRAYSHFEFSRRLKSRGGVMARLAEMSPITATEETRSPLFKHCLELKDKIGLATLGVTSNQIWYDDPQGLGCLLARYKFVGKMLSGRDSVAEVGCGDAFGARVVLQEVPDVTVYDFDPILIEDVRARLDERWPLKAEVHDIIAAPLPRKYDGVFCLGLEYVSLADEHAFLANLRASLESEGVLIIGMRSAESENRMAPLAKEARVTRKSGKELKGLLENYFTRVFLFSMNDEVVHSGLHPMADYLFAICTGPK